MYNFPRKGFTSRLNIRMGTDAERCSELEHQVRELPKKASGEKTM